MQSVLICHAINPPGCVNGRDSRNGEFELLVVVLSRGLFSVLRGIFIEIPRSGTIIPCDNKLMSEYNTLFVT